MTKSKSRNEMLIKHFSLLTFFAFFAAPQISWAGNGRIYSVLDNKPFFIPATQVLLFPCGKVNDCEKLLEPLKTKDELYSLIENGKQKFVTYTDINGQFNYKCPESECLVYARGSDEKNTYIWASIVKNSSIPFEFTHNNAVITLPIVNTQAYDCKGGPSEEDTKLETILNSWNGCYISDLIKKTSLVPDTQGEILLPTGEQGYFYKMALKKDGDIVFGNPLEYNSCVISLMTTKSGVIVTAKAQTKGNNVIATIFGENSRICKRALKGKEWKRFF